MSRNDPESPGEILRFRGGPLASTVPLVVFLAITAGLVIAGAPETNGMIVAAMIGISVGMPLATSVASYNEHVFSLMANRVATVAIVCWLWAGAFAGILKEARLVEAIVWIGWQTGLTGAGFTVAVWLTSALFAVSVGTGLGTVVGFTTVMYPAGILLGSHPGVLMGAIISGAAFGDNLAPISDTTIVSAATQQADVGGVVRSRFPYVLIAATAATLLFFLFGEGRSPGDTQFAERVLAETADPTGWPMLVPAAVVLVVAISGGHFLMALTAGIVVASLLGTSIGVFTWSDLFYVEPAGTAGGALVTGAMSLVPTAILTLLLVTAIGMLEASGFLEMLLGGLERAFARTVRGAEAVIVAMITLANLCVSVNTVAMVMVGPLANRLRKRHGIHAYRSANLLDTVSCSFPYVLPYAATISAAVAKQREVAETYEFVPVLSWMQQAPYMFYGWALFPVMCLAVFTGLGRERG